MRVRKEGRRRKGGDLRAGAIKQWGSNGPGPGLEYGRQQYTTSTHKCRGWAPRRGLTRDDVLGVLPSLKLS